jgi:hypothetical protein
MNVELKPWEYVVEKTEGGGWIAKKADPDTRAKQLVEYKKKRRAQLEQEIRDLDNLY